MNIKSTFILFAFAFTCLLARAQTITTVVGGGIGNHGPLANALIDPFHITCHNGSLYIGDGGNGCIRKIDATGQITTVAGGSHVGVTHVVTNVAATATSFLLPVAVAFDSKENMYVVDNESADVFKIDHATGMLTKFAGIDTNWYNGDNIPATVAALCSPIGIAIDKDDNVFIADSYNGRIRKIATNGIITTVAGNNQQTYVDTLVGNHGPATAAEIGRPYDVCFNGKGEMYIVGGGLAKVDRAGIITLVKPADTSINFNNSYSVAANAAGDVLVSGMPHIYKIDTLGAITPVGNAIYTTPFGMAAGDGGKIYWSNEMSYEFGNIYTLTAADTFVLIAGGARNICNGNTGTDVALTMPYATVFDGNGNMYIGEQPNGTPSRIRKINKEGIINTFLDSTVAFDLCVDKQGNLYAAAWGNVKKITPEGIVTRYAGTDSLGNSGDGGPATAAQLASILSLVTDKDGNLYIGDYTRVKKVDNNGIITTIAGNGTTAGDNGDGGSATATHIIACGLTFDMAGNLLVLEPHDIRKITPDGIITTIAGPGTVGAFGNGGPATAAFIAASRNNKIVTDTAGNIYFTDSRNSLRKIDSSGTISRVAGTDSASFSGDGGPAATATLYGPRGVTIDDSGRVYISDAYNNRIRRINTMYRFPQAPIADTTCTLTIFPNPATGTLHIKYYTHTPGDVHFSMYDATGRRVMAVTDNTTTGIIDKSLSLPASLPYGMYILKVITPEGNKAVQFVVGR